MNTQECLRILNLGPAASDKDLKHAYRKAAKQWHPDHHQQATEETRAAAEQQMRALNTAYTTLTDYYKKHGHLPGYIHPFDETPAKTPPSAAGNQAESASKSKVDATTYRRPTRDKMPVAKILLAGVAMVVAISYLFSGHLFEQNEHVIVMTEPVPNSSPSTTSPVLKPEHDKVEPGGKATNDEDKEDSSPFAAKKRKSAFEQTSRLGIYEESPDDKFFTYGDTAGRVFEIQGVPTRTVGDIWYYGESEVHFQDGRVKSWFAAQGHRLKAKNR